MYADLDRTLHPCARCGQRYAAEEIAAQGDEAGTFVCARCWLSRRDADPDVRLFVAAVRAAQPPGSDGGRYTPAEFVAAVASVRGRAAMTAFVRGLAKLLEAPGLDYAEALGYARGNVGCALPYLPWWRRLWWRLAAGVKPGDRWYA